MSEVSQGKLQVSEVSQVKLQVSEVSQVKLQLSEVKVNAGVRGQGTVVRYQGLYVFSLGCYTSEVNNFQVQTGNS